MPCYVSLLSVRAWFHSYSFSGDSMREIFSSIGCGVHSAQQMLNNVTNNEVGLGNSDLSKHESALEPKVITAELSAYEVFLAHLSDLLIFKRMASIDGISDTITRDLLEQNVYGHLATGTLSYICYDLAAQNLVKRNIECRGSGSACQYFSQEELMRVLVLAFGHTLSEQQRKTVFQSLTDKLSGSDNLPYNKDKYLNLLHMVNNLRSYSKPDVADSEYMHIVEDAVDSLANMVLGRTAGVTGTDAHVKILALEGILLIRSMAKALAVVVKREKVDSSFREFKRPCCTDLATALLHEGELHRIALGKDITRSRALYAYKNFKNTIYGLRLRADIHMPDNSVKILGGMKSILGQVKCVMERIGAISRSEASGVASWIKVSHSRSVPLNTPPACVGLQNNYPIVDYVYKMVVCGSLDDWTVLNKLCNETGKGASSELVNNVVFVSDGKLRRAYDNAVIFQTEKLLENLVNQKSSRRQGEQGVRSMEKVYGILDTYVQKQTRCCRTKSVNNNATEAFRHLLVNIHANLTCGDVFRVIGGPYRDNPITNYRMLALYTHVFCNTSPSVQQSSRAALREAFQKCGEKLPHEIDDMLCVLIDIKNIIHSCGHTAHGNRIENVNIEDEHRSNFLKVLARLMAVQHVICNNKKLEGDPQLEHLVEQHLCGIKMLDAAEILLRECVSLCRTVSELQSHGGSGKSAGVCLTSNALTALSSVQKLKEKTIRCSTSKSTGPTVKKICTTIDDQMKKISGTSEKYANISGLDSKTSVNRLSNIVKTLHNKVWNGNGYSKTPSDTEIDKNLLVYMLGRSYLSARHALEIMTNDLWRSEVDMPSLKCLLGYFRCYKVTQYEEETTPESSVHSDHGSESTNSTCSSLLDKGSVVTGTKVSHLDKVDVAGAAATMALSHHM